MSNEKHCLLLILSAKRSLNTSLKKVYSASVARKIHSVDDFGLVVFRYIELL